MTFVLEDQRRLKGNAIKLPPQGNEIESWRKELDAFYDEMNAFRSYDPADVFMKLSAWTARASYVRTQVVRANNRVMNYFRTQELEPFLVECDRQFKFWSRAVSVMQIESDMGGKVT